MKTYIGLFLLTDTNVYILLQKIWKIYVPDRSSHKKTRLSELPCKETRSVVFYFILSVVFLEASTYHFDIFYKMKYWMFQSFVSNTMIILQRNNQKTTTTTYKEFLGTCITYKHSYLKRKAYIHYVSACKNVSN